MACGPLSFICRAAGSAVGQVASGGFDSIATSFADAARTMCDWMWTTISETTTVTLSGSWFRSDMKLTAAIASVMVTGLFALQVIKGGLRRDPAALRRAMTGCATALLGAAGAVATCQALLLVTDRLCDGVLRAAGERDLASLGRTLTPVALLGGSYSAALVIILSVLFVASSVLVWGVFLVRKAMLIVAAVFAPVAFGGASSDATRSWVSKWVEFTIAMIFSKLAIVVIFVVALSLLQAPGRATAGLSNLLTGIVLLLLASFAPLMVLKLVHFIGGDVVAAHHATVSSGIRSAGHAAATPVRLLKGSAPGLLGPAAGAGARLGAVSGAKPGAPSAAVSIRSQAKAGAPVPAPTTGPVPTPAPGSEWGSELESALGSELGALPTSHTPVPRPGPTSLPRPNHAGAEGGPPAGLGAERGDQYGPTA